MFLLRASRSPGLVTLFLALAGGGCGSATGLGDGGDDGGSADGGAVADGRTGDARVDGEAQRDADPAAETGAGVPCGEATCQADDVCVARTGGPALRCDPLPDGGTCPPNTRPSTCGGGPGCEEIRVPARDCRLASACPSGDLCRCFCGVTPPDTSACIASSSRHVTCNLP